MKSSYSPTRFSKKILEKFKNLYFKKYQVLLTDEETLRMATDMVNLMKVLLRRDPDEVVNN